MGITNLPKVEALLGITNDPLPAHLCTADVTVIDGTAMACTYRIIPERDAGKPRRLVYEKMLGDMWNRIRVIIGRAVEEDRCIKLLAIVVDNSCTRASTVAEDTKDRNKYRASQADSSIEFEHLPMYNVLESMMAHVSAIVKEFDVTVVWPDPVSFGEFYRINTTDIVVEGNIDSWPSLTGGITLTALHHETGEPVAFHPEADVACFQVARALIEHGYIDTNCDTKLAILANDTDYAVISMMEHEWFRSRGVRLVFYRYTTSAGKALNVHTGAGMDSLLHHVYESDLHEARSLLATCWVGWHSDRLSPNPRNVGPQEWYIRLLALITVINNVCPAGLATYQGRDGPDDPDAWLETPNTATQKRKRKRSAPPSAAAIAKASKDKPVSLGSADASALPCNPGYEYPSGYTGEMRASKCHAEDRVKIARLAQLMLADTDPDDVPTTTVLYLRHMLGAIPPKDPKENPTKQRATESDVKYTERCKAHAKKRKEYLAFMEKLPALDAQRVADAIKWTRYYTVRVKSRVTRLDGGSKSPAHQHECESQYEF